MPFGYCTLRGLILMDVQMPNLNGVEAIRAILTKSLNMTTHSGDDGKCL